MTHVFVWTIGDVFAAIVIGLFLLIAGFAVLMEVMDKVIDRRAKRGGKR